MCNAYIDTLKLILTAKAHRKQITFKYSLTMSFKHISLPATLPHLTYKHMLDSFEQVFAQIWRENSENKCSFIYLVVLIFDGLK